MVFDGSVGTPAGPAALGAGPLGPGTDYQIPASSGAETGAGGNLFQSFSDFGIESGRSATFFNDTPHSFTNVIARVTGGAPSEIAGLLRSTIEGSDLWLLNPAGVVFAPGAQLDLPAGLHVSTAESIRFADGTSFSATPSAGEGLATAAPSAFGFVGAAAGDIVVRPGAVVSLVRTGSFGLAGRNVDVGGSASVLNGNLEVSARDTIDVHDGGSLAASGIYDADLSLSARSVKIHDTAPRSGGGASRVALAVLAPSGGSTLTVTADTVEVHDSARIDTNASFGATPSVRIDARTVDLSGGGTINTGTYGDAASGDVTVNASEQVVLAGRTADNQWAGISTKVRGAGAAGDIEIHAPLLELHDQGMITALTSGTGAGGAVLLDVGQLVLTDGSRIEVDSRAAGRPGAIVVRAADSVLLVGSSTLPLDDLENPTSLSATASAEGGGWIEVDAPLLTLRNGAVIDGRSYPNALGDASTVVLRVGSLDMEFSHVVTDSQGTGRAGVIDVAATGDVRNLSSHLDSRTFGSGTGGLVRVTAPAVRFSEKGQISVDAAQKYLDVPGGGASGAIEISAGALLIDSGGILRAVSRGSEQGGRIAVRASESVILRGLASSDSYTPSRILAVAEGDGPAGGISIETPVLVVGEYSRIETSTTGASGDVEHPRSGNAGDVRIVADEVVVEPHARIASTSTGRAQNRGNAGTVELRVGSLSLAGSSEIHASTATQGSGGAVVVRASRSVTMSLEEGRFLSIASSALASTGNGGSVLVETPLLELHGGAGIGATSTGAGEAGRVTVRAGRIHLSDGSEIASDALGSGRAGLVRLEVADTLVIEGANAAGPSGIATRSSGPGAGGSIEIAAGTLALRDGAAVSASSTGTGNAGDVAIDVAGSLVADGGAITTSAPQADGGNITLRVGDRAELRESRIAADVTGGQGGNIVAEAASLILDGSRITAEAGSGQGGTIRIIADVVIRSWDSVVSAAAGTSGVSGTVRIETPEREVTKSLEAMPIEFVDAVTLLHERCAARRGATASFVVSQVEPSPATSGDLLPVALADRGGPVAEAGRVALVVEPGNPGAPPTWRIACGG